MHCTLMLLSRSLSLSLSPHQTYSLTAHSLQPYTGAMEWTSGLGFPVTKAWHPWFGDRNAGGSRVAAGYSTSYGGAAKDFAFVTVKGAGHEVPTFKPAAAFTLFTSFLDGTPL